MVTIGSQFRATPRISREGFVSVLRETGSFAADALWDPTPLAQREAEAGRIYDLIVAAGHDPAVQLAIAGKEHSFGTNSDSVLWRMNSRSWTNARTVRDPSLTGWRIVTDPQRGSNYVAYPSACDSVKDGMYRVDDEQFEYRRRNANSIIEVISIWAPSSDANHPQQYAQQMCDWINEWSRRFPAPQEVEPMRPLRVALAAGHYNTDGGNPVEISLVGHHCNAALKAFRVAGADVRCITPGEGLSDFPGGLQAVARKVVEWANQGWVADIFIEFHTEGVTNPNVRGVFCIYPDNESSGDVDIHVRDTLGPDMARRIASNLGIPVRGNGTMSERQTYVGQQGHRLGAFFASSQVRSSTTRVLIESGSHTSPVDLAVLKQPGAPQKVAQGVVDAVYTFYGRVEERPQRADHARVDVPGIGERWVIGQIYKRWSEPESYTTIFGLPLTGMIADSDGVDVQIFERAIMRHIPGVWPEKHDVLLERIGVEVALATYGDISTGPFAAIPAFESIETSRYFPETGHSASQGFKAFWEQCDGHDYFGLPISEEFTDSATGITVQYFERARFEHHPGSDPQNHDVKLGRLGAEVMQLRGHTPTAGFTPSGIPLMTE